MPPDAKPIAVDSRFILTVWYRNHRGETRVRRLIPLDLRFAKTEWHPEEQWILDAYDVDKGEKRSFAMKDMHHYVP